MLGHREMTMRDYADMLKRRFWLILTCTVLLLGAGIVISHILPPQYVSQTLVLIEQQKVPEDYVKPVINEDLNGRLASMKEQILSRSRIEPIVERFGLYAGGKYSMDDRVDMARKAIGINPIPYNQSSRGMPGFFITFKARDARTAQQVCGEITSLFVSENLNAREQSAEGTTDFLKQQLEDAKRNLDDQDAKLAAFQRKYIGRLPEQESSNSNALQAMTTQLEAATQTINRLQQNETILEAMIAQQPQESSHGGPATGTSGGGTQDSAQGCDQARKGIGDRLHARIIQTYSRSSARSPVCRRRLRAPAVESTKGETAAKPFTTRRSFDSLRLSFAPSGSPWPPPSRIRLASGSKFVLTRRGLSQAQWSRKSTSRLLATMRRLCSSITRC
jgi:hypothetical protein